MAIEVKSILIPVDGSDHARRATKIGAAIAKKFGARVILLHVLLRGISSAKIYALSEAHEIPSEMINKLEPVALNVPEFGFMLTPGAIDPASTTELLVEVGRRILEHEKHLLEEEGVTNIDLMLEDGEAAGRIVETAKKHNVDFVIMGRRGLGMVDELLTGSVSRKVNQLAPCTVVSVK